MQAELEKTQKELLESLKREKESREKLRSFEQRVADGIDALELHVNNIIAQNNGFSAEIVQLRRERFLALQLLDSGQMRTWVQRVEENR